MVAKITIGYFLEDRGHETFIKALVGRVARENGLRDGEWLDDVRSATGGKSIQAYRSFLKDMSLADISLPFDVLIVASDGNCKGYQDKKSQLLKFAQKAKFSNTDLLVFAVPDPHIERWYMSDPHAFNRAFGSGILPVLPGYKCKRGHYKKIMQDAISSGDLKPQFGGYEYGHKIVDGMDLYLAGKADASLRHFIEDLVDAIKRLNLP
jgi:hypothetical protein